jgi:hypothetical protein
VTGAVAFAVTPSLRAEYEGADEEELEYLAMHDAGVASLRLIASEESGLGGPGVGGPASEEPGAEESGAERPGVGESGAEGPRVGGRAALRVVVAADVEDAAQRPNLDRAAVRVTGPVPWSAVAAVHVDSADAVPAVAAAVAVVDAADLGDPDAEFTLGAVEDIDLCWYHPAEVGFMISELGGL